jgi:hypothetical protein
MKKTNTILTFLFITCSILLSIEIAIADNNNDKNVHSPKAKERMDMVKKMKMIEVMELDEAKSEKFLLKFNDYNKRTEENRKRHRELVAKLDDAIKNNLKEITQLNIQVMNSNEEFNKINSEKIHELKGILSETEFAKYLVFENKFINEVFNCFMHNSHKNKVKGKTDKDKAKAHKKDKD